jgi:dimethylaniline monooxygenase (N-oxide forming)
VESPKPSGRVASVCVIGAGASGLCGLKALSDAGLEVQGFERGDRVGGTWVFRNKNGTSSAYRSLHINTSRRRSEFSLFPMPQSYPDYPRHELIADYLAAYAKHFDLERLIAFNTSVEKVTPASGGGWSVRTSDGLVRHFDAVVIANGHHWDPAYPKPVPGRFAGHKLHSHHYIDPHEPLDLTGKRVVVVGFGNSAVDIACELSHTTHVKRVLLSVRRGAWVLPKYLLGRPIDEPGYLPSWLPRRRKIATLFYRWLVGAPEAFGLPKPDHDLLEAHATISSELLARIGAGAITPKPEIVSFDGPRVRFADGSGEEVDAIVYCTGYHVSFPFFAPELVSAKENRLPLFKRVFHPERESLCFLGLCQPLGAIFPIVEQQAAWVAEYLSGRYLLPSTEAMRHDIEREEQELRRRYVASPRHTMQVDPERYLRETARERAKGRRRAELRAERVPG